MRKPLNWLHCIEKRLQYNPIKLCQPWSQFKAKWLN